MRSPAILLILLLAISTASVGHAATEYLIVTTDALAPAFQDFVTAKAILGFETELVTVEDLSNMAVPGRDSSEQIRNHIKSVHAQGSLRYVLLGGDSGQVPFRRAFTDFYSGGPPEIVTDLYFACLDGDWDADEDDVFGEVDDLVDLDPEVVVGRAPVNDVAEAAAWITKTNAYVDTANQGRRDSVLFLGEVLFPSEWTTGDQVFFDGAEICEAVRTSVDASPVDYGQEFLYENDGAYPASSHLDLASTLAALDSGDHGVVIHVGHGWQSTISVGSELLGTTEALTLANAPDAFVLISLAPGIADFSTDVLLENLVRDPDGGAVAAIGWSYLSFTASAAEFLEEIGEELFVVGANSVGDALNAVRAGHVADAQTNTIWRLNLLAINLIGDPSVHVETTPVTAAPKAGRVRSLILAPNPFNPHVSVRFDVIAEPPARSPVRIEVFDLAGHRVRSLYSGLLPSGPQAVPWDGRSDAGVSLASGVYLVVVESGDTRLSAKAVLLK